MNIDINFIDIDKSIYLIIKESDNIKKIDIKKLAVADKDSINKVLIQNKIYSYLIDQGKDEESVSKDKLIEWNKSRFKLGFDNTLFDKMDKKQIIKKKNYILLFELQDISFITDDIFIFANINKVFIYLTERIDMFGGLKTAYYTVAAEDRIWYSEQSPGKRSKDCIIITTEILYVLVNNEFKDSMTKDNFMFYLADSGIKYNEDMNCGKKIEIIDGVADTNKYYIFREFISSAVLTANQSDSAALNTPFYFRAYDAKKITYFITNIRHNDVDVFTNKYYLIKKCSLNFDIYTNLPQDINRHPDLPRDQVLEAFKKLTPSDSEYKDIYLYATSTDTPIVISSLADLNKYEIVGSICDLEPCQEFTQICNTLCATNIDGYFLDILKNAKQLYENAICYQTYNDIHGAIFSFSNCATLFYGIDTILRKIKSKGSQDTFNIKITDQPLANFYKTFDEKNKEVLLCLKNLQNEFKKMNRSEKPEEEDVDTCVNIKNVVFHSKSQCIFFEDIIGLETAKEKIINTFIMPIIYPSLYGKLSKGILLYGPPGTGKTYLVKAAINSLQRDYVKQGLSVLFFSPTPSDLKGKYVGESEKKIKEVFNCASKKACECQEGTTGPSKYISVIFIDEIDNVGGNRSTDETGMSKQTVNALLQAMDGLESHKNIIVIGATNNPWELDSALLRRFNNRLFINLPNDKNIRTLVEKEFITYISNTTSYTDMCKKKDKLEDNKIKTCSSVCNEKEKKEININEQLMTLNGRYNILPNNYENIIQKLSADMYKKQFSNSDINQLLRVCFSKMGSRTIQNELFINLEKDFNQFISGQSTKDVICKMNTSIDWRNPTNIKYLDYFFGGRSAAHYYLSSFNKNNYEKFAKPFIQINNEVYLNIIYCIDRHPLLYLSFENVKAAYIKRECYESMVKLKNGDDVSDLTNLVQCKILIEKDVEIISEMKPLIDKYKSKIISGVFLEKVAGFWDIYGYLLIFISPTIFKYLGLAYTELLPILNDILKYKIVVGPNVYAQLNTSIAVLAPMIGSKSLLEYIKTLTSTDLQTGGAAIAAIYAIIKCLITTHPTDADISECYNLYIIQSKPFLILYHMIHTLIKIESIRIAFMSATSIVYNEDSYNNTIQFKINGNAPYIVDYINTYQNSWNKIIIEEGTDLHTNYTICINIIKKLTIDKDKYSKIYIPKGTDFKNCSIVNSTPDDLYTKLGESNNGGILKQCIIHDLISNLQNNKSLSIKKTLYFECEIDLAHKFNIVWDNKIEYLRRGLQYAKKNILVLVKYVWHIIKYVINLLLKKKNSIPETIDEISSTDDTHEQFFDGINKIYKNITYLLLSNCNAYYYANNEKNTFTRVLINDVRPHNVASLKESIPKNVTVFLKSFLKLLTMSFGISMILPNLTIIIIIYICSFILGDLFFDCFEIPPLRTLKIANLLKQEKIFVSFNIFKEMSRSQDFSKLFNQTTSYMPLLNYVDTFTGLNRILYKFTKNTDLISFSNTFTKDRKKNYLQYMKFHIEEEDGLSLYHNNHSDNITTINGDKSDIVQRIDESIVRTLNTNFLKRKSANAAAAVPAAAVPAAAVGVENNTLMLLTNYISNHFKLVGDDIISIRDGTNFGKSFTTDKINEFLVIIQGQTITNQQAVPNTVVINEPFYIHSATPLLKNYTIHFDIISEELHDKNSLINPDDYVDLIKYDKEPDSVIKKRLTNKQTESKSLFAAAKRTLGL